MDARDLVAALDAYQQRHPTLALPLAVVRKFSDDQGGRLAALLSYRAFFSIFPLLLALTTILGFILQAEPGARTAVERSVLGRFPIIGPELHGRSLSGSTLGLIVGVALALWSGLAVTQAAQQALDRVWAVPIKRRPTFARSRGRGLVLLLTLGVLFIASSAIGGSLGGGLGDGVGGVAASAAGYLVTLAVNVGLFYATFRIMVTPAPTGRELLPGVAVASVLWTGLQALQGYFIARVLAGHSSTYGTFAAVIALLIWLHLGAQILLYSAELNVVIGRRLWPRSLAGAPATRADRLVLDALAKIQERSAQQSVEVKFKS